jgi:tetratricopeptide (TPR) repeat protein
LIIPTAGVGGSGFGLIGGGMLVGLLLSILIHELAHAIVGMSLGATVVGIRLDFFGGATYFSHRPPSYLKDILISLAGPASNLMLWGVCNLLSQDALTQSITGSSSEFKIIFYYLSAVNLFLGVFNALPCYPMDGGQALYAFALGLTKNQRFAAGLLLVSGILIMADILFDAYSPIGRITIGGIFTIYIAAWILYSSVVLFSQSNSRFRVRLTPRQQVERQKEQAEKRAKTHAGYTFFEQGQAHLLAKDYGQAITSFTQAIQLEPKEMSYLDYRAYTYVQMGNYAAALADYNLLLEKQPKRADFFTARAQVFKKLNNIPAAKFDVEQALRLNSMDLQANTLKNELDHL